ncbi:uncharacterized protein CIMG_12604 [Coccidioides immitis RS]|uniref:Uncharacterized protein n=1 Tax=Coccidioides immitis (strain RS) TaxID=246410 RepID=J3KME6_COCIM|nr:uncharacterized protein CIMG_12604 [Coccidioides immitis RS]EAS37574.3 hypothetical protein CIMG_12604 [Coccidioides immitis RS]
MAHYKYIIVNADNIKLILDISAMTESNYFSLIDVSDCPASAAPISATIICCLCSASAPSTTPATAPPPLPSLTTTSLSLSSANRVSTCQMVGIRAPVWFTKPVLEEQKEEKKKKKKKKKREKKKRKKKKEKENDDNNKNNNNDENDELAI